MSDKIIGKMTTQQHRVITVLNRMVKQCEEDDDNASAYSDHLEVMLDDLSSNDFFGTEGQCDPRGDQRDEVFTMYYVQGIDE